MVILTQKLSALIAGRTNLKWMRFINTSTKLIYFEHGDPIKVITKETEPIGDPDHDEVLVKMLAAPVNPADINTIQGKYPVQPPLPSIPGNEGVGEVIRVGSAVTKFKQGDRVVPICNALGTWRTHFRINKNSIYKIPSTLGLVEAATLTVNPCTAFRMLRDFADLQPGDSIIQNGANSACGQNVIQIARAWGISTVNIVRDRAGIADLRTFLKELGGTHVLTEEELRKTDIFRSGELKKPKLALNCVGGQNALEILRRLEKGGTMVTYGGMSREPVTVPTSALIFKDLKIRGFWMTEWSKQKFDSSERYEMLDEIINLMVNNKLQGPSFKMVNFDEYKEALMNTLTIKGMIGKKYILDFTSNC